MMLGVRVPAVGASEEWGEIHPGSAWGAAPWDLLLQSLALWHQLIKVVGAFVLHAGVSC